VTGPGEAPPSVLDMTEPPLSDEQRQALEAALSTPARAGASAPPVEVGARELTIEDLVARPVLPIERVDLPVAGGYVFIQTMSAARKEEFERTFVTVTKARRRRTRDQVDVDYTNYKVRLVAWCLSTRDGEWHAPTEAVAEALAAKLRPTNSRDLERMTEVANRLNGMTEEDLETIRGNSSAAPGDGS